MLLYRQREDEHDIPEHAAQGQDPHGRGHAPLRPLQRGQGRRGRQFSCVRRSPSPLKRLKVKALCSVE